MFRVIFISIRLERYKGHFTLISYGDEPSVSNGVVAPTSLVPPIHTPSASLSSITGSCPTENYLPATALICNWLLPTKLRHSQSESSADARCSDSVLVSLWCVILATHTSGSFPRTLHEIRNHSGAPAWVWGAWFTTSALHTLYAALVSSALGRWISRIIFSGSYAAPVFNIV